MFRTVDLSETCRVLYQNKFEKWCITLAFIIRIYHDARSYECQMKKTVLKLNTDSHRNSQYIVLQAFTCHFLLVLPLQFCPR